VIFLGTPHRGSPDLSSLGEWARSLISTFRMETTSAILDTLGLKNTDLERAQEEFSGAWQKHDFRVKTFQEGLGLMGVNLGVLGNKVVPDTSSLIGDRREHAETIQANHMEMCRFTGNDDPNYRKVGGEINAIYRMIIRSKARHTEDMGRRRTTNNYGVPMRSIEKPSKMGSFKAEKDILQSLWFPNMHSRLQSLERPAERTCIWLFEHEEYQKWFNGQSREDRQGLLWFKGKPGTGKSMLMKEAFRHAMLGQPRSDYVAVAFFFNAKGTDLEHSPLGIFRSLLYQLLPHCTEALKQDLHQWVPGHTSWDEKALRSLFQEVLVHQASRSTFIFIDALDECDSDSIQPQAHFWRGITKWAYAEGVHLNVCLSSRHFPSITVGDCPEIIVENHNNLDITTYVELKFRISIAAKEPQWKLLRDRIIMKSAGVFLWVVLVVEEVLQKWDHGKGMQSLLNQVDNLPVELETLFSQMFQHLDAEARQLTVKLFQWIILAARPCRLHEWHHILAFIRSPVPGSLSDWRSSDDFTQTDDHLQRQLRSISKGLVEVNAAVDESQKAGFETISIRAGAGSLDLEQGETRVVQVMHESVREFFLHRNGFSVLLPGLDSCPVGRGHLSIMKTCLDYIHIKELDALVEARDQTKPSLSLRRSASIVSGETGLHTYLQSNLDPYHTMLSQKPDSIEKGSASLSGGRQSMKDAPIVAIRNDLSDPGLYSTVMRWMSKTRFMVNQSFPNITTSSISTRNSVKSQSILLEDFPALLPYTTAELFTHARLAEFEGADPSSIINNLNERNAWSRWVTLREDLPRGIELLDYVTDLRLSTWKSTIVGRNNREDKGWGFGSRIFSPYETIDDDLRSKASSRSHSVASFSSAGSFSRTRNEKSKANHRIRRTRRENSTMKDQKRRHRDEKSTIRDHSLRRPDHSV
jgi:hypothetical protein